MTIAEGDPLTNRQRQILVFFHRYLLKHGYQPSYEEIAKHCGFNNRSAAYGHMDSLTRKGWFESKEKQSRCLKILLQPDGTPFKGLRFVPTPQEPPRDDTIW
jgi:SOS-response transcriptional repressor LexA